MNKHKHHDLIVAWAAGATIEHYWGGDGTWNTVATPMWTEHEKYRIKPEPPKTVKVGDRLVFLPGGPMGHETWGWYDAWEALKQQAKKGKNVGILPDKTHSDGYGDGYVDGSGFTGVFMSTDNFSMKHKKKSSCNY